MVSVSSKARHAHVPEAVVEGGAVVYLMMPTMPMVTILTDTASVRLIDSARRLKQQGGRVELLTMDAEVRMALKQAGLPVRFIQEEITSGDIAELERAALDALTSSCRSGITAHAGVNYGEFLEFVLIQPIRGALTHITVVEDLLSSRQDSRFIVVGAGPLGCAASRALAAKGVPHERWGGGALRGFAHTMRRWLRAKASVWVSHPFKDVAVEFAQSLLVIFDAFRRPARTMGSGPCLVVPGERNVLPVMEPLHAEGWSFMDYGVHHTFRREHFREIRPVERSLMPRHLAASVGLFFRLLWRWFAGGGRAAIRGAFRFHGVDYWREVGLIYLSHYLLSIPRLALYHAMAVKSMSGLPRGSILLCANDDAPVDRTMISAAHAAGVTSVLTQHGIFGKTVERETPADVQFAWGRSIHDWYRNRGLDARAVVLIGSPRYDALIEFACNAPSRSDALEVLGLPPESRVIVVLTAGGRYPPVGFAEDVCMVEAVAEAANVLGLDETYHIAVKPHPIVDIGFMHRMVDGLPRRGVRVFTDQLKELLVAADVCVGRNSSTVLEAMFFRKPSIVYYRFHKHDQPNFMRFGAAIEVSNTKDLTAHLGHLLHSEEARQVLIDNHARYIEYEAYSEDGHSTERFVDALRKLSRDAASRAVAERGRS
jgi:hypothetical protein